MAPWCKRELELCVSLQNAEDISIRVLNRNGSEQIFMIISLLILK